ncbi:hypothetical protein QBC36DRAFT_123399 [Triangularia setosa]|uniref:Uncharacterized protein n=1 Tax=Triangularia setosa TaxID=2587417 RepID=A0AAN6W9U6_9PEZI|nr:hypothetical protein QBC36DRAFT_123399 [Podospora setosa]
MAAPHGTKRHREHDDSNEGRRPAKITIGDTENYPVAFWSDYSQLPRLCWSLRDLDHDRRRSSTTISAPAARNITIARVHTSRSHHSIAFPPPPQVRYLRDLQPSLHTNHPRRNRFQDSHPTSTSRAVIRPAVYNLLHEQNLLDHRIYLPSSPQQSLPPDLEKLLRSLETPIPSLTASSFPPDAFQAFLVKHSHPPADDRLLPDGVLDTIAGHSPAFPHNNIYVALNAMKPVNDIPDIIPVPYAFDGVRPSDLEHKIRDEQEEILVTTKRYELPVAPNFFFESRRDGQGESLRAAAVDGAYGARGMYVLKTYGQKKTGEAGGEGEGLAFSGTYEDGISGRTGRAMKVLRLYAHHVTKAAGCDDSEEGGDVEGRLTYHMTELGSWEMTGSYEEFLKGARAFRNLRLWAAMVRLRVVDEANDRVSLEKK